MAKKFERLVHEGHKIDGKLVLKNARWFKGMLQQTPDCPIVVTVERKRKNRTKEQMGYIWGVVYPHIADHTGHTPEDLHEIFKAKYLRRKKVWRNGNVVTVGTTNELSSNEMAEFITNIIVEANELGINVPPPDQAYQWR